MNEREIENALKVTAYTFVLLSAVSKRALTMAERWANKKGPAGHPDRANFDQSMLTTSSTEAHPLLRSNPSSLVEYRACVELALVLARSLNDMVDPQDNTRGDDVVAWKLIGVEGYTLPGIGETLRKRINKGSSLHLVNFDDNRQWGINRIREWAVSTANQFEADMITDAPERAKVYTEALDKYRSEMEPRSFADDIR